MNFGVPSSVHILHVMQAQVYLKPWFHVKIKLFYRILGLHGTTSEMK